MRCSASSGSLRRLGDFHTRFIDRKRVLKLDAGILELSDDGGQLIDLFAEFLFSAVLSLVPSLDASLLMTLPL